jgi:hypothetical protein
MDAWRRPAKMVDPADGVVAFRLLGDFDALDILEDFDDPARTTSAPSSCA